MRIRVTGLVLEKVLQQEWVYNEEEQMIDQGLPYEMELVHQQE